jgi:hypothetical protein
MPRWRKRSRGHSGVAVGDDLGDPVQGEQLRELGDHVLRGDLQGLAGDERLDVGAELGQPRSRPLKLGWKGGERRWSSASCQEAMLRGPVQPPPSLAMLSISAVSH